MTLVTTLACSDRYTRLLGKVYHIIFPASIPFRLLRRASITLKNPCFSGLSENRSPYELLIEGNRVKFLFSADSAECNHRSNYDAVQIADNLFYRVFHQ